MSLSPRLLEILVCPEVQRDLEYKEPEQVLVCNKDRLRFPIREDIPIMLIDEATPFSSAALAAALLAAGAQFAAAQSTSGTDAGVFLLLPTGAQSVGMGPGVRRRSRGSESVWWNPPGSPGRPSTSWRSIIHRRSLATGDVLAFVIPSKHRGAFALSVNILNPGEQQVTDDQNQPVGVILPTGSRFRGDVRRQIRRQLYRRPHLQSHSVPRRLLRAVRDRRNVCELFECRRRRRAVSGERIAARFRASQ